MKNQKNYIEQDNTVTTAFIIITGIAIIASIAVAFDNVNVLWTLNIIPSCVQAVIRKQN